MLLKRIVDIKVITLAAAAMLCGCSDDVAPATVDPVDKGADIVLTLYTADSSSRLSSRAPGDPLQAATIAENRIDIDGGDYRVLVFGKDGRLLERIIPTDAITVVKDDYSVYSIEGRITQTAFMGNADGSYEFQIMVLANWQSLGGADCYDKFGFTPGKTFIDDVVALAREYCWSLSPKTGWRPFNDGNKGIPMFGLGSIAVTADQVSASRPDNPIKVGEISLLRAMAKIEIVDNIAQDYYDSRPEITASSIAGHLSTGTLVPDLDANPGWNIENTQVVSPTEPADPVKATAPLRFFSAGKTDDGHPVYAAYVAEQDLKRLSATSRPAVSVTIKIEGDLNNYNVQLSKYENGDASTPFESILRNHIYRFEIVRVSYPPKVEIYYTVCPWASEEIKIPDFE